MAEKSKKFRGKKDEKQTLFGRSAPLRRKAPVLGKPQKLSRSKIELSLECPRCFWLDGVGGVKRPPPAPYTINSAIDYLLKQEFDVHRENGTRHPIMERYHIEAKPFAHEDMDKWRHNFTGVQFFHEPSGFLVTGAVDDVWVDSEGALIVVDYKATGAKEHKIYDSYRRQMEVYQWLLRQNGFTVSPTGYFVFARVNKENGFGFGKAALGFDMFIEGIEGDDSWVCNALTEARKIFDLTQPPEAADDCEYCAYRADATEAMKT